MVGSEYTLIVAIGQPLPRTCRRADWILWSSVFLIAATNTFVRFVHFNFGSDYRTYLDANGEKAQKTLVNNRNRNTFVYMQCSSWFDLNTAHGRRKALCHVLALLRWHDKNEASDSDSDSESDSERDFESNSENGFESDSEDDSENDSQDDSEMDFGSDSD